MHKPPEYRRRTIRGREIAIVRLPDVETKTRRDYWLGEYGSPESREKYARLLAEWESRGRRLLGTDRSATPRPGTGPTITECIASYLPHLAAKYPQSSEAETHKSALRVLRELYGETPIEDFTPKCLTLVREAMIAGKRDADGKGWAREPWSRKTINGQIHRLRSFFRWCVAEELAPAGVWDALRAVESLRRGRTEARECDPVRPVPLAYIEAIRPRVSRQVRAMVDLQLLTGMRPNEVVQIRWADIDVTGEAWTYRPVRHKTQHHGLDRVIHLGPRAQAVLNDFKNSNTTAAIFSPFESEAERSVARRKARETPMTPSHAARKPKADRRRPAGDTYSVDSYRRAIERACDVAEIPRWTPNRLRHNAATVLRKQFGIEAARVMLGHTELATSEIYAERDQEQAAKIAAAVG